MSGSLCFRDVCCPVCGRVQHALGVESEGVFLFQAECLVAREGCGVQFDDEGPVNGLLTGSDVRAHGLADQVQGMCRE